MPMNKHWGRYSHMYELSHFNLHSNSEIRIMVSFYREENWDWKPAIQIFVQVYIASEW